jgi:hypothetical protein
MGRTTYEKLCECGCGELVEWQKWHNARRQPRFINGHHYRYVASFPRPKRPLDLKPEQIPSGLCECGCGGQTAIAAHTSRTQGRYAGYPAKYIKGHNTPRSGDRHPNWNGGVYRKADGYVLIRRPDHPHAKRGYVAEHRLVMETTIGRLLKAEETVHHINGVRHDNRPENLELWSHSQPYGQRVADKVAWAKELLELYAPHLLANEI